MNHHTRIVTVLISAALALVPSLAFAAFDTDLRMGDRGTSTATLQQFLIARDLLASDNATGFFGPLTLAALKAFQTQQIISPISGFFGPLTRAHADALLTGSVVVTTPTTNTGSTVAAQIAVLFEKVRQLQAQLAALNVQTPPPGRTVLHGPTTFYVTPSGDNATGDGSQEKPWASPLFAYNTIQQKYDLSGQSVTIKLAHGIYPDSITVFGPLTGQTTSWQVVFEGDTASQSSVVIQPKKGYAFGAAFGAMYSIRGMLLDERYGNDDTIMCGQNSEIDFKDIIFGYNIQPFNHVSVAYGCMVHMTGNYSIQADNTPHPATFEQNSSTIHLSDSSTGIVPYMGVVGPGIPAGTFVGTVNGTTVTLSKNTTQAFSGAMLTFSSGAFSHISVGDHGRVLNESNGVPNIQNIYLSGRPFFYGGFLFVRGNGTVNIPAMTFQGDGASGIPFDVRENSSIYVNAVGVPYLPGSVSTTQGASFSSGQNTIALSSTSGIEIGNAVNGYTESAATYAAHSTTLQMSSTKFIQPGNAVSGAGMPFGAHVTSVSGNTVTLEYPTVAAGTNSTVVFTGTGVANGTYVTAISGNTITLSQPTVSAQNGIGLFISGHIASGGQYR